MSVSEHPAVRRVTEALARAGVTGRIVVLDEHARTAAQAAQQLGVTVAQIANSLVFSVPDDAPAHPGRDDDRETDRHTDRHRALLVLTSGGHRVDTAKVAGQVGAPRLDRATPDFVRRQTGFAIGGVAPVGHLTTVQTLVDVALAEHEVIWAAAGHPRTVFATTFAEPVQITGGTPSEVA